MKFTFGISILAAIVVVGSMTVWFCRGRVHAAAESHAPEAQPAAPHTEKAGEAHGGETAHESHAPQESEKAGHGHGGEGAHEEDIAVISEEQIKANNIKIEEAGTGAIAVQLALPGEVRLNADNVAHVVPRVAGVVREVKAKVGDDVKAGQVMAVLESRELANLKAEYLAARERESLAKATYEREKGLRLVWDFAQKRGRLRRSWAEGECSITHPGLGRDDCDEDARRFEPTL